MKKTKGTFGGCDGLMAFKTRKIMMAFVGAIGAIWLFGATNLPRAIAVGDSVKMAMTVGAAVKIPFKVVDDAGTPVSGAKIMVGMWMGTVKDNGADGVTDRVGMFTVRGKAADEVVYSIDKEGYYRTSGKFLLSQEPNADVKGGKWMPYGKERLVVLKRIANPIPMYAKSEKLFFLPELNKKFGFDAVTMDWVQPLGTGKHTDIYFEYKGDGLSGTNYRDGQIILTWADKQCGFYARDVDESDFKSPYHAETNMIFAASVSSSNSIDRRFGRTINDMEGKCLVFRIRPRFSPAGTLAGAQYGKIYGPIRFSYVTPDKGAACFRITIYTNPTENDTNLEFLPGHSLNYPLKPLSDQPNILP